MTISAEFLPRAGKPRLAYLFQPAKNPERRKVTIVFFTGFRSEMRGEKAEYLARSAEKHDFSLLRFDYSGHGESEGNFEDLVLSDWLDDALTAIDTLTTEPLIIIGSSMGGWLGLRAALLRPDRVKGFIGISTAPDFTRAIRSLLSEEQIGLMKFSGKIELACDYGQGSYPVTEKLILDGENHILLDSPLPLHIPIRLFQGGRDTDVPYETAIKLLEKIQSDDIRLELVKEADHRFSRPDLLARLESSALELLEKMA